MAHILVADDEALNLALIREILEDLYELDTVEDGQACLDAISVRVPDLLLLDVNLPRVNGLDVCRRLREREETKKLPIVVISAHAAPGDRESGLAAGATDYLAKPFDISGFRRLVQTLLD